MELSTLCETPPQHLFDLVLFGVEIRFEIAFCTKYAQFYKTVLAGISFLESRFWGRLGAALGQTWSRRGAKRGADPGQACFRRGQKGAQKRWNPRLESAIWGARLKASGRPNATA